MLVTGSGERVFSCFIMSHTCSIGEKSGDLAGQGSCCTPWTARWVAADIRGRSLSSWKSTSPSCQRNGSRTGLTPVQCSGHCLFTLQKRKNVTASCNWWPPHHEAWYRACVLWVNALSKIILTRSTPYIQYIHHLHTDRTYSHHWRQQSAIPFPSRLFHNRIAVLGGVVV